MDDAQVAAIAGYLGISEQEVIDRHTRLAPDRRGLVLADADDGACCFLDSDNRCRIYPVRPRQCRDFPTTWRVPDEFMRLCQGKWE